MTPGRSWRAISLLVFLFADTAPADAISINWDDGGTDKDWSTVANWNPNGDPAGDELTIGDILAAFGDVTIVDQDYSVASLTVLGTADVDTAGNQLVVNGASGFSEAGTTLLLRARTSGGMGAPQSFITDTLFVGTGAAVEMYDNSVLVVDNGQFFLNGALQGNGEIQLNDGLGSPTSLMSITGTLSVGVPGFVIAPPPRTLRITANDLDARLDFDGAGAAIVNLQQNSTLDINVPIADDASADPFSGTINLGPGSTLDVSEPWQVDGSINANTSLISGTATATIAGALLTLNTGATVTLDEADESLRFAAPLSAGNGSSLANSGTVVFDAVAEFSADADFQLLGSAGSLVVNADVDIGQNSFDIDGDGLNTNVVTVNPGAVLTLNVDDFGAGDLKADGTITINSGELSAVVGAGWTADGTINLNNTNGNPAVISAPVSHVFSLGDDAGASDANLIVGGMGESQINVRGIHFHGGSDVDIAAGATLVLNGIVQFNSSDTEFDGDGTLRFGGSTHVNEPTTLNLAVVDLDGDDDSHWTLEAALTLNTSSIDVAGDGFDGDLVINHNGSVGNGPLGSMTVNSPSGIWQVNTGTITVNNQSNVIASVLFGDAVELAEASTVSINGPARTHARLEIFGTVELATATDALILAGGDPATPDRIEGGTVNGDGGLYLFGTELHGYGNISADISVSGNISSREVLMADDGMLTLEGAIIDSSTINNLDLLGVTDDGTLEITNAWNTDAINEGVVLEGGEITGAAITNDSPFGIRGHGRISAQVINETFIHAQGGDTLVVEEDLNLYTQDWDGTSDSGSVISEGPGSRLLLHRVSPPSMVNPTFGGMMQTIDGAEIVAENISFTFAAGSLIQFDGGGFATDRQIDIHGDVSVATGSPATISANMTRFRPASSTTLGADLILQSALTVIDAGATFTGGGALINEADSELTLRDGAVVGVTIENSCSLTLDDAVAASASIDALTMFDSGTLRIELGGVVPGQWDVLGVAGNAVLDGTLAVSIIDSYVPLVGNSFTILTTEFGAVGNQFDVEQMPVINGVTFDVLYNDDSVVLSAVEALPGDFNTSGAVENADLTLLLNNWAQQVPPTPAGWTGIPLTPSAIDNDELTALLNNWGAGIGSGNPAADQVPEPDDPLAWIVGIAACLCGRSRSNHCAALRQSLGGKRRQIAG